MTSPSTCKETNFEVNKALVEWIEHLHNCKKMPKEQASSYMKEVMDFLVNQEYDEIVN